MDSRSDPRDVRIAQLELLLRAALETIERLKTRVAELEDRLGQNSNNSSKPPSSDPPGTPRTTPTGRRRGGQPGREGAKRVRLPANAVIDHRPSHCRCCGNTLTGSDPAAKWTQVLELPEIKPHVTEHRAHALRCHDCGVVTAQALPNSALLHGFGPRLSGLITYLSGRCRLSKRQIVELCADAFGTPVSTGAVCAIEQDVSSALALLLIRTSWTLEDATASRWQ